MAAGLPGEGEERVGFLRPPNHDRWSFATGDALNYPYFFNFPNYT